LKYNCLQKLLELDEFNEQYMFLLLEFLIEQNKKQDCLKCFETIQAKLAEIGLSVPKDITNTWQLYRFLAVSNINISNSFSFRWKKSWCHEID